MGVALLVASALWALRDLPKGQPGLTESVFERLWLKILISWPILVTTLLSSAALGYATFADRKLWVMLMAPSVAASIPVVFTRLRRDSLRITRAGSFLTGGIAGAVVVGWPESILVSVPLLVAIGPAFLSPSLLPGTAALQNTIRLALRWILLVLASAVLLWPGLVLRNCTAADPCWVGDQVVTLSVTGNGNVVSLYLALLAPWVAVGLPRASATLLVFSIGGLALLAGGEASLLAVAVATWARRALTRRAALSWLLIIAVGGSLWPVLGDHGSTAVNYRGTLWIRAKDLVGDAWLAGHGSIYWADQSPFGAGAPNYSAHNVWLDLAVASGLVGVAALVGAFILVLRGTSGYRHELVLAAAAVTVSASTLENPIQFYRWGIAPFVLALFLLSVSVRDTAPQEPSRGPAWRGASEVTAATNE
jgi:hypothetical protein